MKHIFSVFEVNYYNWIFLIYIYRSFSNNFFFYNYSYNLFLIYGQDPRGTGVNPEEMLNRAQQIVARRAKKLSRKDPVIVLPDAEMRRLPMDQIKWKLVTMLAEKIDSHGGLISISALFGGKYFKTRNELYLTICYLITYLTCNKLY